MTRKRKQTKQLPKIEPTVEAVVGCPHEDPPPLYADIRDKYLAPFSDPDNIWDLIIVSVVVITTVLAFRAAFGGG